MTDYQGMVIPFGKGNVLLAGGPYRKRPSELAGVKMAEEIDAPWDVSIPTRDFSVPDQADMIRGLWQSLWILRRRKALYVGCMGGVGRTGLFMAVMYRLLTGVEGEGAIIKVRAEYKPHAVETDEQKRWVSEFEFPWWLRAARTILQLGA